MLKRRKNDFLVASLVAGSLLIFFDLRFVPDIADTFKEEAGQFHFGTLTCFSQSKDHSRQWLDGLASPPRPFGLYTMGDRQGEMSLL